MRRHRWIPLSAPATTGERHLLACLRCDRRTTAAAYGLPWGHRRPTCWRLWRWRRDPITGRLR